MDVRAFYRTTQAEGAEPPYNNVGLKIYYPCSYGDSFEERNTGFIPADSSRAPFPVVIILPGVNLSHESYSWLACELARSGLVVATYSWITRELGLVSISPGVDLAALSPERYGRRPSCPALPAVIEELERVNEDSLLQGQLDLQRIIFGGHSAGGTMALINSNSSWYPQLRGCFSYAAHTAANSQLGWEENSMMPLSNNLPLLIMGGSRDGVIEASGFRYSDGELAGPTQRIRRTFDEGIRSGQGDRHLLIVEGANHFSFADPADGTTGRPYLDHPEEQEGAIIREYLAETISAFCHRSLGVNDSIAARLDALCNETHPLAAIAEHK